MAHPPLQAFSIRFSLDHLQHLSELLCPICDHPVRLELAKTDENGRAIHEQCYVLKLRLKRASDC